MPEVFASGRDGSPGHCPIFSGLVWKKTSKEGRDYLSVKLDDPSWPQPVYASLIEAEDGKSLNLLWSRPNGD